MDSSTPYSEEQGRERTNIRRARAGDPEAFGALVFQHTPMLYRVVRRLAQDDSEAEAIVQETFLRIWKNLAHYKEDRPFLPYLVTVALNLSRDRWRRERLLDFGGLEPIAEVLEDPSPMPEIQVEQAELLQALAEAMQKLPTAYRAVISLRYEAGLSYQEMAQALELPVNTVRTHLRRAKEALRYILESQEYGDETSDQ